MERQLLAGQGEASPRSHRRAHERSEGWCVTPHMARCEQAEQSTLAWVRVLRELTKVKWV